MAIDFTVVTSVRQRFGDEKRDEKPSLNEAERGLETQAPFVGAQKSFPFQCPNVDPGQSAILLFQGQGVSIAHQHLEINGVPIFGGIPASFDRDSNQFASGEQHFLHARWHGSVMLVHPGVLRESNVLLIRAAEMTSGNIDDFVIDNVVVLFKMASRRPIVAGDLPATARARRKKGSKAKRGRGTVRRRARLR